MSIESAVAPHVRHGTNSDGRSKPAQHCQPNLCSLRGTHKS